MATVAVRIVGTHLPGAHWCEYEHVHVGVQRGREVVDPVAGDAERVVFGLEVELVTGKDGDPDFRGKYVQGSRGERFLYLSWGIRAPGGTFEMFRRAKLHLGAIPTEVLDDVVGAEGRHLEGTLHLTDGRGGPLCASVRPPVVTWTAASEK